MIAMGEVNSGRRQLRETTTMGDDNSGVSISTSISDFINLESLRFKHDMT